jgi:riboflavin synthase alpha subunit
MNEASGSTFGRVMPGAFLPEVMAQLSTGTTVLLDRSHTLHNFFKGHSYDGHA